MPKKLSMSDMKETWEPRVLTSTITDAHGREYEVTAVALPRTAWRDIIREHTYRPTEEERKGLKEPDIDTMFVGPRSATAMLAGVDRIGTPVVVDTFGPAAISACLRVGGEPADGEWMWNAPDPRRAIDKGTLSELLGLCVAVNEDAPRGVPTGARSSNGMRGSGRNSTSAARKASRTPAS